MSSRFSQRLFRSLLFIALLIGLAGCGGKSGGTAVVVPDFDGGQISDGSFEFGSDKWFGNATNLQPEPGNEENTINFADVATAGAPFDVNLSQVTTVVQGKRYTLNFRGRTTAVENAEFDGELAARTANSRTIIAGIGLNEAPFTNTGQEVTLTTEWQNFELTLDAANFGSENSRVLFDMGADTGVVMLDDVVLDEEGDIPAPPPSTVEGELLSNGSFEDGTTYWIGNAANVTDELLGFDASRANFANLDSAAANPFDVNLSQVVAIEEGEVYTLTFKAKSDGDRTMIAGIGLNEGDFANNSQTVNLTSAWQTFTLTLAATGFGSENSRVLFDMGADAGVVIIDDVSLMLAGDGSTPNTPTEPTTPTEPVEPAAPTGNPLTLTVTANNASEVRLTGPFWNWDPAGGPVAVDNGDGTWTVSLDPPPTENMEYLWVLDGVQENLVDNNPQSFTCTPITDNFSYANRLWNVGSPNVTDDVYDFCPGGVVTPPPPPPVAGCDSTGFDDGLLTNGNFEAGVSPWIGNAANVTTELLGCNASLANFANVEAAGNSFDVNLSQVVAITQGETYTLTFKAKSDVSRTILAGIGLNEAPWTNTAESVSLTTDWQTYTLVHTANFDSANSRVLFDMGADTGVVIIDEVSLTTDGTVVPPPPPAAPLTLTVAAAGATEVRMTGPFWNWDPAGGPIAVDNGDGTWTVTLDPAPTADMEYLWIADMVQENLVDNNPQDFSCTPITDGANYANRQWTVGSANVMDDIYDACSVVAPPPAAPLTLTVAAAGASEVRMTGPFWNWDPAGGPIAVDNGDGTWTVTLDPAPTADMEYLWIVDMVQENFVDNSPQDFSCTPITDGANYANRQWTVGSANVTDDIYDACSVVAPPPAASVAIPLDFELAATSYTLDQFGDAILAIVADPANASNNTLKMTRPVGAQWWAGGTIALDTPEDATSGAYSLDLYSTSPLAYVELKFEQDGSNFIIMTTTHGGTGWETLNFDTSTGAMTGAPSAAALVVVTPRITADGSHTQVADEMYFFDNIQTSMAPPPPPPAAPLTLTVAAAGASEVRMTGPFWNWDPAGGPIAVDNGDGTWTVTLDPAPTADMEYLWIVDMVQENLVDNSPQDFSCTPITDGANYANRQWTVGSANVTGDIYDACSIVVPPATDPTTAPPSPTQAASDVISVYSDAYTDITGVNTNPNWGQGTATTAEIIAGNNLLKMTGLDYQGIDFDGNRQNVSCMTTLHVDYWTTDATQFDVYAIGSLGEAPYNTAVINGSWQSLDIPLSTFGAVGLSEARQFKFVGNGTVYVDNLYFYNAAGAGNTCTAPPAGPTPADAPATPTVSGAISLYSDAYADVASNTTPGWSEVVTDETYASNNVKKTTNFLPFALNAPIDISSQTTMHVDVWLPALPSAGAGLLIKLLDAANGPHEGNYIHPVSSLTAGQWNSIDIPLSSFTQAQGTWDANAQSSVDQVLVDIVDDTTMFVDNVYFY